MQKLELIQAAKLTSPNPVTLICSTKPNGAPNIATVSWWTIVSLNPPMLVFAMAKTSFTGETVRNTKKVVLTIPGSSLQKAVYQCGSSTGRETDKATEFNIEMTNIPDCDIVVPVHTCVAIPCNLKEYHEVGDHYLYICNVGQVYGDETEKALFAWNGYSKIQPVDH